MMDEISKNTSTTESHLGPDDVSTEVIDHQCVETAMAIKLLLYMQITYTVLGLI